MSLNKLHPLSLFIFFAAIIIITVLSQTPFVLIISFVFALTAQCFYNTKSKAKTLIHDLLLFLIISLINPIFSHNGKTILFFLNDNQITLEAFLYGANSALMIVAVICWCSVYSKLMGADKTIYLTQKIMPKTGTVLALAVGFVPKLKRKYVTLREIAVTTGKYDESLLGKCRLHLALFSALITRSLEDSIITADSMRARGFGDCSKTYSTYRFKTADFIMIFICAAALASFIIASLFGISDTRFYPEFIMPCPNLSDIIMYVFLAVLGALPIIFEFTEKIRWKFYSLKI